MRPAPAIAEPFPGPRPFSPEESEIFKGRSRESRDLRDLILSYQVVVFHSHSGSGKTSLVNAGLLPLLRTEGIEPYPSARVGGEVPPGLDPAAIGNIYSFDALSSCFGSGLDAKAAVQQTLEEAFGRRNEGEPRLLILDQFEELFTSHPERWHDRKPFIEQLSRLCSVNKDLRVLMVIRDDHLAELDTHAELLPYSLRIRYRLERLTEESALKGIIEPLHMAGYGFEPGVAESLVSNLRKIRVHTSKSLQEIAGEFVEPVHLQVVCQNLWKNRSKETRVFSAADVEKFADVNQALRSFYDQALTATVRKAKVREAKLRWWFGTRLITSDGTRGLVHRGREETESVANRAVEVLEQEHVIRAEPRAGGLWYEITHDRFVQPIRDSNRVWSARRRRDISMFLVAVLGIASGLIAVFAYRNHQETKKRLLEVQRETVEAQNRVRLAGEAEAAYQFQQAIEHYTAAIALYRELGDRASQGDAEFKLGSLNASMVRVDEAERHLLQAIELHRGNWRAEAQDEASLGGVLEWEAKTSQALEAYKRSLSLHREHDSNDLLSEGTTLVAMGWTYWQLGDLPNALASYHRAKDYLEALKNQLDHVPQSQRTADKDFDRKSTEVVRQTAAAYSGLATIYGTQGRSKEALEESQKAVEEIRPLGDRTELAALTLNLGYAYFLQGNYLKSLSVSQQAEDMAVAIRDQALAAALHANESVIYTELGKYDKALQLAERAIADSENMRDVAWTGNDLWAESLAYLHLHQLDKAQKSAQRAQGIFHEMGQRELEARAQNTLGEIAEAKGDREQAFEYYQSAVQINNKMGNHNVFAQRAQRDFERLGRSHARSH